MLNVISSTIYYYYSISVNVCATNRKHNNSCIIPHVMRNDFLINRLLLRKNHLIKYDGNYFRKQCFYVLI